MLPQPNYLKEQRIQFPINQQQNQRMKKKVIQSVLIILGIQPNTPRTLLFQKNASFAQKWQNASSKTPSKESWGPQASVVVLSRLPKVSFTSRTEITVGKSFQWKYSGSEIYGHNICAHPQQRLSVSCQCRRHIFLPIFPETHFSWVSGNIR